MAHVHTLTAQELPLQKLLQQSILQLCSDNVFYRNQLQVLGILCLTIDGQAREVVIKVNSTLKRVQSLPSPMPNITPRISPKQEFSNQIDIQHEDMELIDSAGNQSVLEILKVDNEGARRGRKQKRPIKACSDGIKSENALDSLEFNNAKDGELNDKSSDSEKEVIEHKKENDEKSNFKLADLLNKKIASTHKNTLKFDNINSIGSNLETKQMFKPTSNDKSSIYLKNYLDNNAYRESDCLDLSLRNQLDPSFVPNFIKMNSTEASVFATMSQFFTDQNATGFPPMTLNNILSKQYLNMFDPSTLIGPQYRGSLNKSGEASTSNYLSIDQLSSTPDADLVVDRLNSDTSGRKRRRRGLDDALTSDEIIEYLGFKEEENSNAIFVCPICRSTASEVLKYFHHTLLAHRSFVCHECGRCFSTKSSLLRHRPIHTGLRRYACAICQKAFYRKDKCKAHVKRHSELRMLDSSSATVDNSDLVNDTINDSPETFEDDKSTDLLCVA